MKTWYKGRPRGQQVFLLTVAASMTAVFALISLSNPILLLPTRIVGTPLVAMLQVEFTQ